MAFLPPDVWYAGLPGVVIAAGALFTDPGGRVLLVKPNYRDHWTIPGGICEHGEPPHLGAAREVAEETGLAGLAGPLLTVDWGQPYGLAARPIMHFVFDGGTIAAGTPIRIQAEELDGYQFTQPGELAGWVPPFLQARLAAALAGRAKGYPVYQPTWAG
jgi:8-oxo-dGTP pyrophosphatase MutT (NUDIX family)